VRVPTAVSAPVAVRLTGCRRSFRTRSGETYVAVDGVDLTVQSGEFVSLVGPTGCGKTTILNLVAGLLAPDAGRVEVFGEPLQGINRRATYLFQQDVLLPWKTAEENVMLGLLFRRVPKETARERARAWLARVGLRGFEDRYPYQLSGGMRKRVALAQSLIVNPEILLMDEPFAALDVQTRQIMENDLLRIWQEERKTVLFVTHDLDEAIALSDRVVLLSAGPAARPVAEFPIDLPRPRDVAEVRLDPRFQEVYGRIWERLRGEVLRTYAHRGI